MSVSFKKTGVVSAPGTLEMPVFNLVNENNLKLTDENGNYLTTGGTQEDDGFVHGFVEGGSMMSIYSSAMILANEFIEW